MHEALTKVAIVTGSTQGLGEAIARKLVAERMVGGLVICGRNTDHGARLASELTGPGCRTELVPADLTRVADCQKVIDLISRQRGATECPVLPARPTRIPRLAAPAV